MNHLKPISVKSIFLACIVTLGLTACDQSAHHQGSVAWVDMGKVLKESAVIAQEQEHNKKVRQLLLDANKTAQQSYADMSAEQKQKSESADALIINRQWAAEQNHARSVSMNTIAKAVESYREKNKLTLVMDRTQVIAADPKGDISEDIIGQLKEVKIDYGAMPQINVKAPTEKSVSENKDTK